MFFKLLDENLLDRHTECQKASIICATFNEDTSQVKNHRQNHFKIYIERE